MSTTSQKQAGDLVTISGGAHKGKEGILQEKLSKGWNIKLRSGEVVLTSFPFIKLIAKQGEFAEDASENPPPASEQACEETVEASEDITQPPSNTAINEAAATVNKIPENIAKMTTVQLRDLAKQKGVSIARTKADFLRIIKEVSPGENLDQLKGKALFDRVSELHISRLRSKEDLQKLLAK